MGQSTDAILFYGIELDETNPLQTLLDPDHDNNEFEVDFKEWLCERLGGPKKPKWDSEANEYVTPWVTWREAMNQFLKDVGLSNIDLDTHCSSSYPMYYLSAFEITANRGYPVGLDLKVLDDPAELRKYNEQLEHVAKLLKLENYEVSWYLASYWGA
jgi:hypothetical protein